MALLGEELMRLEAMLYIQSFKINTKDILICPEYYFCCFIKH